MGNDRLHAQSTAIFIRGLTERAAQTCYRPVADSLILIVILPVTCLQSNRLTVGGKSPDTALAIRAGRTSLAIRAARATLASLAAVSRALPAAGAISSVVRAAGS